MGIRKAWWGRRGWVRAAPRLASAGNWRGRRDDDSCLFRLTSRASRDTLTRRAPGPWRVGSWAALCPGKSGPPNACGSPQITRARPPHTQRGKGPSKRRAFMPGRARTRCVRIDVVVVGENRGFFPVGFAGCARAPWGLGFLVVKRRGGRPRRRMAANGAVVTRIVVCHCVCWCCVGNRGV